jgi:hypothetical protein
MIAETKGMFNFSAGSESAGLYFTKGVFNNTLGGVHCFVVSPGINKYSPKVLETSSI